VASGLNASQILYNSCDKLDGSEDPLLSASTAKLTFASLMPFISNKTKFWYALNILSAVGVVLLNKRIFSHFQYRYGIVLTFYHFSLTALGLRLLAWMNFFEQRAVPLQQILPLSLSFCLYVVLTNISLQYNSGTFYQILVVPMVATLQYLVHGTRTNTALLPSMLFMLLGVGLATLSETKASWIGVCVALCSILATAIYQILVNSRQKQLTVSAIQLLYHQAPTSAAILLCIAPIMYDIGDVIYFPYTDSLILTIVSSALCAFFLNLSTYLVLNESSVLTYSVVGLSKLFLVLGLNYWVFESAKLSLVHALGVLTAFTGMCIYCYKNYKIFSATQGKYKL